MPRQRRFELAAEARRLNQEQLARAGAEIRASRTRRRWRQADLAARVGLVQSTISDLELGRGGSLSLDVWQRIGLALGRPLRVDFPRDQLAEPADSGHLKIQELALRLGRTIGFSRTFELATRPSEPNRSADVGLRDDARRILVLIEAINTNGDIGASTRASRRKVAEAEAFAVVAGKGDVYRVASCWIVRATRVNRALVARYPEVFASSFPGSSSGWVDALTKGTLPPEQPGLIWCDVACTRLFAWRRRR